MAEPSAADRRADFLSRLDDEEFRQEAAASDRRSAVAELRRAAADLRAVATALRQLIAPDARPG